MRVVLALFTILVACHRVPKQAAPQRFARGVTVNHWLSSNYDEVHAYGAPWFDEEDVAWIAEHGFDHVRMRVSSTDWLRADGTLDEAKLAPLDRAIAWCDAHHLGMVIAMVGFPGFTPRDEPSSFAGHEAAADVWGAIAKRYAERGNGLRFEIVHYPNATDARDLAAFQRRALGAIRAVSPTRFVYLTTNRMSLDAVADAMFSDAHTGLAVKYGWPEDFTFQIDEAAPLVRFADTQVATIDADIARLAAAVPAGREIYVAQFGVYHRADVDSQQRYLRAVVAALARHHLPWSIYDYESGCAMRAPDGLPTPAYAAVGLRPEPRVLRFTMVDGGAPATMRIDGRFIATEWTVEGKPQRAAITLDADGTLARYTAGEETFAAERAGVFYIPVTDDPFVLALLASAARSGPRALEPTGTATVEAIATSRVNGAVVSAFAVAGADFTEHVVWLDGDGRLFAILDDGAGLIASGHEARVAELEAAQTAALARRDEALANRLVHRPANGLLIRHARLFDPATLAVRPDMSILILGSRIAAVGTDIVRPDGVDELDARGRFVMPGMWDSHSHLFGRGVPIMQLAAGVTTVRDMGNETDLPARVRRFDAGLELGPHVLMVERFGWDIIPDAPKVTNEAEAKQLVETYAARGYVQIKTLDGVDPAVVPALARHAHARGLRLSGHVPGKMTTRQFVDAGADEIQHVLFVLAGKGTFDASSRDLLAHLARKRVTLDDTLAEFEISADGRGATEAAIAARMPPLVVRGFTRQAIEPERRDRARARFEAGARALATAVELGVTIVPGTDQALPGFLYRRELELYVAAGLAPAKVLQIATLGAARNMGRDASLVPGAVADLIVVDGDPTRDIRDLERVEIVVKDGWWVVPDELLRAVAIRPHAP